MEIISNVKIEHVGFGENLYAKAIDATRSLYLVKDEQAVNLTQAERYYEKVRQPLTAASKFLKLGELKDLLLANGRIVLREEKLSVVLFELLKPAEKKELGIENYNDIIEFSARFHRFYRELAEYQVDDLEPLSLTGWKKERMELIESLKERFLSFLKKEGYTAPGFHLATAQKNLEQLLSLNLFSLTWFSDLKKIVLLNTVFLTPLEKALLIEIARQANLPLKFYLQLREGDFSAADQSFRGLTMPEKLAGDVAIYQAQENTAQLASALQLATELKDDRGAEHIEILTPKLKETGYQDILSANKITMSQKHDFSSSHIYQFMAMIQKIMAASPRSKNLISLVELKDALGRKYFRDYFSLPAEIVAKINGLLKEDYLYLDPSLAEKNCPEILDVFTELAEIKRIKSMPELVNYLDKINLEVLSCSDYWDDIEKFYDALLELKSLEEMGLVSSWLDYYDNPTLGLLDRLLQYLEFKKITPLLEQKSPEISLVDLDEAAEKKRQNLVVLNCNQGWLPVKEDDNFILSERERQQIGLPTLEEKRERQRYHFFRQVFSADQVVLLAIEDIENNLSAGAFLEELRLNYDLEVKPAPVREKNYPELYDAIFSGLKQAEEEKDVNIEESSKAGKDLPWELGAKDEISQESDPLIKKEDFLEENQQKFRLGYYKYAELIKCPFRFMLKHLFKLDPPLEDIDKIMSYKTFGSMVHFMAEELLKSADNNNLLEITANIPQVVDRILKKFSLKIDHRFELYYQRVIRAELEDSLEKFIDLRESPLASAEEIKDWKVEYSPGQEREQLKPFWTNKQFEVDLYLSGRIDLLLEYEDKVVLVDFKSGNTDKEQLNFYALQLKHSDQEKRPISKYFYQVMERKFYTAEPNSELKFRAEMEENLEEFFAEQRFSRNSRECYYCDYKKVCRVVEKDEKSN